MIALSHHDILRRRQDAYRRDGDRGRLDPNAVIDVTVFVWIVLNGRNCETACAVVVSRD
jgi:hypothetical protein